MSLFSRAEKTFSKLPPTVGPGAYQLSPIQSHPQSYAPFTSTASKIIQPKGVSPGPGQYNPESIPNKIKSTPNISSRFFKSSNQQTPGPGYYLGVQQWTKKKQKSKSPNSTTQRMKSSPSIPSFNQFYFNYNSDSMVPQRLDQVHDPSDLGPGSYNPKKLETTKGTSWSKSKSTRKILNTQLLKPGPGFYTKGPTFITPKPSCVFRSQTLRLNFKKGVSPGPGSYLSAQSQSSIGQFSFPPDLQYFGSKAKRFEPQKVDPKRGPGSYSQRSIQNEKVAKFGKTARFVENLQVNPGPGYYMKTEIQRPVHGISKSSQKRFKNTLYQIPGPGQYKTDTLQTISHNKRSSHKSVFNSKTYRQVILKKKNSPAPGSYQTTDTWNLQIPKEVLYSQSPREKQAPFNSTVSRFIQIQAVNSVGPGSYTVQQKKTPKFMFSTEKRFKLEEEDLLGPGSYLNSPTWKIPSFNSLAGQQMTARAGDLLFKDLIVQFGKEQFQKLIENFGYSWQQIHPKKLEDFQNEQGTSQLKFDYYQKRRLFKLQKIEKLAQNFIKKNTHSKIVAKTPMHLAKVLNECQAANIKRRTIAKRAFDIQEQTKQRLIARQKKKEERTEENLEQVRNQIRKRIQKKRNQLQKRTEKYQNRKWNSPVLELTEKKPVKSSSSFVYHQRHPSVNPENPPEKRLQVLIDKLETGSNRSRSYYQQRSSLLRDHSSSLLQAKNLLEKIKIQEENRISSLQNQINSSILKVRKKRFKLMKKVQLRFEKANARWREKSEKKKKLDEENMIELEEREKKLKESLENKAEQSRAQRLFNAHQIAQKQSLNSIQSIYNRNRLNKLKQIRNELIIEKHKSLDRSNESRKSILKKIDLTARNQSFDKFKY